MREVLVEGNPSHWEKWEERGSSQGMIGSSVTLSLEIPFPVHQFESPCASFAPKGSGLREKGMVNKIALAF